MIRDQDMPTAAPNPDYSRNLNSRLVAHCVPILVADIVCLCGVYRYVGFAAVSLTSQAITVTTRPKVPSIRTRMPADRIAVRRPKALRAPQAAGKTQVLLTFHELHHSGKVEGEETYWKRPSAAS
jgi:hypothetical protein